MIWMGLPALRGYEIQQRGLFEGAEILKLELNQHGNRDIIVSTHRMRYKSGHARANFTIFSSEF